MITSAWMKHHSLVPLIIFKHKLDLLLCMTCAGTPMLAGLLVVCLVVGALRTVVSILMSGTASGTTTGLVLVLALVVGRGC